MFTPCEYLIAASDIGSGEGASNISSCGIRSISSALAARGKETKEDQEEKKRDFSLFF